MNNQIAFIHALRGIAVLLVVWVHIVGAALLQIRQTWPPYTLWKKNVVDSLGLFQHGGHLGVILFFLVSGYIITHVSLRETRLHFLVHRLFRLFPVLVVALVLAVGVSWMLTALEAKTVLIGRSDTITDAVLNLFSLCWILGTPHVLGPTWSLLCEFVFYAFVAAAMPIRNPIHATLVILCMSVAVVLPFIAGVPVGQKYIGITIYLPILVAGRCMYFLHRDGLSRNWLLCLAASWLTFFGLATAHAGLYWLSSATPAGLTYIYAMVIFTGAMLLPINRVARPLAFVADVSYSLYLLHFPVACAIIFPLAKAGHSPTVIFPMAIAACLVTSALSYRYIEKPFQALGRRIARNLVDRRRNLVPTSLESVAIVHDKERAVVSPANSQATILNVGK